jgi:WhiB family transcriptional regulator, redox-sensing transcriptional regulator
MDQEHAWMARGLCTSIPPATFFPSDGAGVEVARKICASCPVREACLEHALVNRIDHGVWGGCSERERRRILKRRRATRSAEVVSGT